MTTRLLRSAFGRTMLCGAFLCLFALGSPTLHAQMFTSSPNAQLDNAVALCSGNDGQGGLMDVITTSGLPTSGVSLESVDIHINHTWVGDVQVSLVSSQGTRIHLFSDVDGSNDSLNITLIPGGVNGIFVGNPACNGGGAPAPCYVGEWAPDSPNNDFSAFDGEDPNGDFRPHGANG